MSISLSSAGQLVMQSSGLGANCHKMTLNAPVNVAGDVTLSLPDPGANANIPLSINGQFAGNPPATASVSVATALTVAQSGSFIPLALNGAANFALTLPASAPGLNYKFIVTTAGTRNCTITPVGNDTFSGYLLGDATLVACANKGTIVMTAGSLAVGDSLDIIATGTNVASSWVVRGFSAGAGGFA
jgi:hypothetical protein